MRSYKEEIEKLEKQAVQGALIINSLAEPMSPHWHWQPMELLRILEEYVLRAVIFMAEDLTVQRQDRLLSGCFRFNAYDRQIRKASALEAVARAYCRPRTGSSQGSQ